MDVPFLCAWRRATEVTDAYPYREIRHYLPVWVGVGDLCRAAPGAQERHVHQGRPDGAGQAGHGQRQPAALALPGDDDPGRIHRRVRRDRVDGQDRVGDQPAVVIGLAALDAACGEAGILPGRRRRAGVLEVGRVTRTPAPALSRVSITRWA